MINLDERIVVWWPGVAKFPVDGGETKDIPFDIQCVLLNEKDEVDSYFKLEKEDELEFLFENIKDWKGFVDKDGNEVPYSKESFIAAMRNIRVGAAIRDTWRMANMGAATKN